MRENLETIRIIQIPMKSKMGRRSKNSATARRLCVAAGCAHALARARTPVGCTSPSQAASCRMRLLHVLCDVRTMSSAIHAPPSRPAARGARILQPWWHCRNPGGHVPQDVGKANSAIGPRRNARERTPSGSKRRPAAQLPAACALYRHGGIAEPKAGTSRKTSRKRILQLGFVVMPASG